MYLSQKHFHTTFARRRLGHNGIPSTKFIFFLLDYTLILIQLGVLAGEKYRCSSLVYSQKRRASKSQRLKKQQVLIWLKLLKFHICMITNNMEKYSLHHLVARGGVSLNTLVVQCSWCVVRGSVLDVCSSDTDRRENINKHLYCCLALVFVTVYGRVL